MTDSIQDTVDDLWTAFEKLPKRRKDMASYTDNDIEILDGIRDGLEGIVNKHRETRPTQERSERKWRSFVGNAELRAQRERN
jgi:hypothetical protein